MERDDSRASEIGRELAECIRIMESARPRPANYTFKQACRDVWAKLRGKPSRA